MTTHKPLSGLLQKLKGLLPGVRQSSGNTAQYSQGLSDRGLLTFAHTGDVIRAERVLHEQGFTVAVKGPPPQLRTGCDMVVVFPLIHQTAVLECLKRDNLVPEQVVSAQDVLLDPVSLYPSKRLGRWLMVRAANMKITIDTEDGRIVNISGGGCPDVPWLAHCLCGLRLAEAPEPLTLGSTLCCYSLQKAFEEIRRQCPCG